MFFITVFFFFFNKCSYKIFFYFLFTHFSIVLMLQVPNF
jgi:hypothetical protein